VAHLPLQIDALVMTPLFRQGRWVACLTAGCHHARAWTAAEVYLVETVAERVWLLFENARLLRQTAAALDTARETQRALEGRTAELVRSNEDLQRFANFISHDLRSPLRSIQAFSQLISARYQEKLGDEGEEWLIFIRNGAERMSRLIDDLLDYSRASNSDRAVSLSDCNHLLESALLNLQHAIEESGAVITSEPLPALPVDPQLVRVFQNLIDNAIKYRWAGRVPRIHVSVQNEGNCWRFSVQDNGIGFEMEHAERIFRIFQRLHPEGQFEGTGIGLAVCRQIIERQGGKIWAESVPGRGSSFHFTVPAPAGDLR
jgi:light-regulated signal transduction histidine kinase (bacteriophytochrome)